MMRYIKYPAPVGGEGGILKCKTRYQQDRILEYSIFLDGEGGIWIRNTRNQRDEALVITLSYLADRDLGVCKSPRSSRHSPFVKNHTGLFTNLGKGRERGGNIDKVVILSNCKPERKGSFLTYLGKAIVYSKLNELIDSFDKPY